MILNEQTQTFSVCSSKAILITLIESHLSDFHNIVMSNSVHIDLFSHQNTSLFLLIVYDIWACVYDIERVFEFIW
jgi:hypothetical protein